MDLLITNNPGIKTRLFSKSWHSRLRNSFKINKTKNTAYET